MSKEPTPLPGRALKPEAMVTVVFEIQAFVTGTRMQLALLHNLASNDLEVLYKFCDDAQISIVQAHGQMRAMRSEEAIAVLPRKKHYSRPGNRVQICSTPHVSDKHLTENEDEVTCKLCLKELTKT